MQPQAIVCQHDLDTILSNIKSGHCCRIYGPPNRGKSKLIHQVYDHLATCIGFTPIYINLRRIQFQHINTILNGLYQHIQPRLDGSSETTRAELSGDRGAAFAGFLMDRLRRRQHGTIVLLLDDVEFVPSDQAEQLIAILHTVIETARADDAMDRLCIVTCSAKRIERRDSQAVEAFLTQSQVIQLHDLSEAETHELVYALGTEAALPLRPRKRIAARIYELTAGDRFLIERVMELAVAGVRQANRRTLRPRNINDAAHALCNGQHHILDEHLNHIFVSPDFMARVAEMIEAVHEHPVNVEDADEDDLSELYMSGMFALHGGEYRVKCDLWLRILQVYLSSERIWSSFATLGRWDEAFAYVPIQDDPPSFLMQISSVIVAALHEAKDTQQAVQYLGRGLETIYPDNDVVLYLVEQETRPQLLRAYHPMGSPEVIPLTPEGEHPALRALEQGYDVQYIYRYHREELYFPLRVAGSRPIGVLSLRRNRDRYSIYEKRLHNEQIISLLDRAALVLYNRLETERRHRQASDNRDRLHELNHFQTKLLANQHRERLVLYKILLAGVTCDWGLGFNRAVFFQRQNGHLVALLAVGHNTEAEARHDWAHFEPENSAALIELLLAGRDRPAPLHQRLAGFQVPLAADAPGLNASYHREIIRKGSAETQLPPELYDRLQPPDEHVVIPVHNGEAVEGVLYVDNAFSNVAIDDLRIQMLQAFTNQAASIIHNGQLLLRKKYQVDKLQSLLDLQQVLSSKVTQNISALLDAIAYQTQQLLDAYCVVIFSVQPNPAAREPDAAPLSVEHIASNPPNLIDDLQVPRLASGIGMSHEVMQQGMLEVDDVETADILPDDRKVKDFEFIKQNQIQSFVGVRLGQRDQPVGILYVNWRDKRQLLPDQLNMLQVLSSFCAIAIVNTRQHQLITHRLERSVREKGELGKLIDMLSTPDSLPKIDAVIEQQLAAVSAQVHNEPVGLYLREPIGQWRTYLLEADGTLEVGQVDPDNLAQVNRLHDMFGEFSRARTAKPYLTWQYEDTANTGRKSSAKQLLVPIWVSEHCIAVAFIVYPDGTAASRVHNHRQLLLEMTRQLSLILREYDNVRVLASFYAISQQLTAGYHLADVLESVTRNAAEALRAVQSITLYYKDWQTQRLQVGAVEGAKAEHLLPPEDDDTVRHVASGMVPLYNDEQILANAFCAREGVRACAAFPLLSSPENGEQTVIGCMFFNYGFPHDFDPGERNLLDFIARTASIAIYRNMLLQEKERERERLARVERISRQIKSELADFNEVLRRILEEIKRDVQRADNICYVRLDRINNQLVIDPLNFDYYHIDLEHRPAPGMEYRVSIRDNKGIAGRAIVNSKDPKSKEPTTILIEDTTDTTHPYYDDYIAAISSTRSQLCVPIPGQDAALVLESDTVNAFGPDDEALLNTLANHIAIAVDNAARYTRTQQESETKHLNERAQIGLFMIHEVNRYVANIPGLVREIREIIAAHPTADPSLERELAVPLETLVDRAVLAGRFRETVDSFWKRQEFEVRVVNVADVIMKAIEAVQDQRPDHVGIILNPPGLNLRVQVAELWFQQIIANLLVNAFRHIPIRADQSGKVDISVVKEGHMAAIRVCDNGVGIDRDQWDAIFQPSVKVNRDTFESQVDAGLGIGLYTSRLVAEKHEGRLCVETSKRNEGTTFLLTIPAYEVVDE